LPEAFSSFRTTDPGKIDDRLINSVDFAPTMLTLAGLTPPDSMHGRNFLGEATERNYVFGARDRMDERYDIIRAVRDKRFRFVRNFEPLKPYYQYMNTPEKGATMKEIRRAEERGDLTDAMALFSAGSKPTEELYDLENDPHEINNLATDPEHKKKLDELRAALFAWQLEVGDLGLIPESEIERVKEKAGSDYAILRQEEDPAAYIKRLTAAANAASTGPDFASLQSYAADEDPSVRYWAATGIGNFSEQDGKLKSNFQAMTEAVGDPSPAVRIAAARALCRMGETKTGLSVLTEALAGENQWARLEAAIVLDELDETARPALEELQAALKDQPNKYIIRVANKAVNDLLGLENRVP
jgi:uncharacterized sulfatase